MAEYKQDVVSGYVPVLQPDATFSLPSMEQQDIMAAAKGIVNKKGFVFEELLTQVKEAEGEALVVLPLAAEDEAFATAVLQHFAAQTAAGTLLAAKACGATQIIVLAAQGGKGMDGLKQELEKQAGDIKVEWRETEATPVLREESALLPVLQGKPARSELLQKPITQQGLDGRPTLAIDVETACWLSVACAAPEKKQGKLMLLVQKGNETLFEVPLGQNLGELQANLQLTGSKPSLLGGVTGFFSAKETIAKQVVSYANGYDLMEVFAGEACMADVGKKIARRADELSCGKCVLCREGSWQMQAIYTDITEGRGRKTDFDLVPDIGGLIKEGAFCDFGKQMVVPAMTLMEVARPELEVHVTRKTCPAGVCTHFTDYVIDPSLCTGCGDCLDVCKEDAIEGKPGFIHMIDPVMCTKCGECVAACSEGAIVATTKRIKVPKKLTKAGRFK